MKRSGSRRPGPIGVGRRGEADVRIFGIAVTDPVTITEFEPPAPLRDQPRRARSRATA